MTTFGIRGWTVTALWLAATCAIAGQAAPTQDVTPKQDTQSVTSAAPVTAPYRLTAGDVIEVRHAFNAELNEQAQIRPDGRLSFPLIGETPLAGLTIAEAVSLLESQYAKEVKTARITIQVRGFANQKVFVTGEVGRPGMIPMPGHMTVLEALSEAGGVKLTGNRKSITLVRRGADGLAYKRTLKPYAGKDLSADASMPLQPFDVIIVPESKIARVDRWVDQNIRQLLPFTLNAGFTYLWQREPGSIPIF